MNSNIKISVIVPIYNVEDYLKDCLDSILSQSLTEYEVILINDGSTDNSPQIAESYKNKFKHCTIIHQTNKGLSNARNIGVANASGDFLFFLDSDDYILPDTLKALYSACEDNNCDLAICGVMMFGIRGERIIRYTIADKIISTDSWLKLILSGKAFSWSWNKLYSRSIWEANGHSFPVGRTYEDISISISILESYRKIALLNTPYYQYRLREGSIVSTHTIKKILDFAEQSSEAKLIATKILKRNNRDNYSKIRSYIDAYSALQWSEASAMLQNLKYDKTIQELINIKCGKPSPLNILFNSQMLMRAKFRYLYYYFKILIS